MKTYIYQLVSSDEKIPFYVGKTNNPKRRLNEHINESLRKKNHSPKKESHIREILNRGADVIMNVLTEVETDWREIETFYIQSLSSQYQLVNAEMRGK